MCGIVEELDRRLLEVQLDPHGRRSKRTITEVGQARDRQGRYLADIIRSAAARAGCEQEVGTSSGAGVAGFWDEPQQHGGVVGS